jgi:hypothetical protein
LLLKAISFDEPQRLCRKGLVFEERNRKTVECLGAAGSESQSLAG